MRVRLVKKHAEMIDGIDLSRFKPGDSLELSTPEARLLIAEGWAERPRERRSTSVSMSRAQAADDSRVERRRFRRRATDR